MFGRRVRSSLPNDFVGRAAAMTGEPAVVDHVVSRIRSLDGRDWVPYWAWQAMRCEDEAFTARHDGRGHEELAALRRSSAYYSLAAYPVLQDEERQRAYGAARRVYLRVCELENCPVEVFDVPYDADRIRVYLRRPSSGSASKPLILFIRGLDSTKEVTYWDDTQILARGHAIASVDFPGMGENVCAMTLDTEKMFQAILDAFGPGGQFADAGVTVDRTVAWGLGFGGYWAYKLAAVDARVSTAISVGGPVHHAFSPSLFSILSRFKEISFLKAVTRRALGTEYKGSVAAFAKKLSLLDSGLLTQTTTPLLYVNGSEDQAVTPREAQVVSDAIPNEATRNVHLVEGAGHLAIEVLNSKVLPLCLQWIADVVVGRKTDSAPLDREYA